MTVMTDAYAVILAGGKGTRFWPVSREANPKQFLSIVGTQSMIRQTFERISPLIPPENTFIMTNTSLKDKVQNTIPEINPENILLEPVGRNTGPSIAWISALINSQNKNAKIFILASDHVIEDIAAFRNILVSTHQAIEKWDAIVTIGIKPSRPETGYGYLKLGSNRGEILNQMFRYVERFVEKPDQKTASHYLETGDYLWNSGMFAFSGQRVLSEFGRHQPEIFEAVSEMARHGWEDTVVNRIYPRIPSISIDYAIMEKVDRNIIATPSSFGWSDIGSWEALYAHLPNLDAGNRGRGEYMLHDCTNTLAYSTNRLIVGIGLNDIVIVETEDTLLVCTKKKTQYVGEIVKKLNSDPARKQYL